jgi:NAD(P)H-dependent FMN reductase
MKTIVAIGGSNSSVSINKQLAIYAASQVAGAEVVSIDLNTFSMPLYGIDEENTNGIPENAINVNEIINSSDGIVLSLAEHNGAYTAAFKSMYDWLSRIDKKVWKDKPMLLMATSPGGRGGQTVLGIAKAGFPFLGGNIIADFSLPFFNKNFTKEGIIDVELNKELNNKIDLLSQAI